jgi:dipeptidyl aminopeptidase/acylaminoacyl peptidase
VVQRDGSKRLLGRYDEAAWSPHGLFVVATRGRQLVALEPNGRVRWSITAPRPVGDARWSPSGFRIAYRSGSSLRVVAGDGTGDRELAARVAPIAPAWRPGARHVLTFAGSDKRLATMDVDSVRVLSRRRLAAAPNVVTWSADGRGLAVLTDARAAAFAPKGRALAVLRGGEVRVDGRRVFAAPGRLGELAWSPDGRWLLVTLPDANQWLFVRPGAQRLVTASAVAQQFDPGATGAGAFPKVVGWAP